MSIPNEISMLVIKSQNRARSPCKRWDTPENLGVSHLLHEAFLGMNSAWLLAER